MLASLTCQDTELVVPTTTACQDEEVDVPLSAGCQDEELDVPLASLVAGIVAGESVRKEGCVATTVTGVTETHVGESSPPAVEKKKAGDGQKDEVPVAGVNQAGSPLFSSYLPDFELAFGSRSNSSCVRRG